MILYSILQKILETINLTVLKYKIELDRQKVKNIEILHRMIKQKDLTVKERKI